MPIQHLEQFDQCQRRLRLAILIAREGVNPTTKNVSRFTLVKVEFLAHFGNVGRINIGGIDLPLKRADQVAVAVAMLTVLNRFATSRTKVARDVGDGGVFALIDVRHIAGVVDQLSRSTARAFHGHNSLKETIRTSSITVSLR